jgi:eukaryotic-like serine/threonine-protein kinase
MATPAQPPSVICFGPFELDAANLELRKAGVSLKIHPQPFQVLLLLAGRPRQIITRDEIRSCLWGGNTFVDFERGINSCINQIRAVIGDDPEKPRYIETVPRRGYRFIAAVSTELRPNASFNYHLDPGLAARQPGNGELSSVAASAAALHVVTAEDVRARSSDSKRMLIFAGCLALVVVIAAAWWIVRHRTAMPPGLPDLKQFQLTANSSENAVTGGAISPDGKYLAYSDTAGIHIKLIQTGDTRDVPQPEILKGMQVSWSIVPNWALEGARIIATANVPGRAPSIWSVPVIGGTPRKIRDEATATGVTRDGSWVAFTTRSSAIGDDREIWMMTAEGEQARKLYDGGEHTSFGGPEWSPDGQRLVYIRHFEEGETLEFSLDNRDLRGGPAARVLPTWVWDLNWSPDGRLIYSLGDPGPFGESCSFWGVRLDAQAGNVLDAPTRLMHGAGFCMDSLSMTVEGKKLAFRKWSWQGDVYVADMEGAARITAPQRLTLNEGRSYPAAWTPDSKAVIFGAYRDGQWGLFKQVLGTGKAEYLATVADAMHLSDYGLNDFWSSGARVSPDGAWLLFLSAPPEIASSASTLTPTQLMRIPMTGGAAEMVMTLRTYQGPACARTPATLCVIGEESSDLRQLVFTGFDPLKGRGREIARFDTDPVARYPHDYLWDLSADGGSIAILQRSGPAIYVLSLRDRTSRTIPVKDRNNFQSVNWAADGKGLIVASATDNGAALLHVDLLGNAEVLWEQKGNLESANTALAAPWGLPSPDGRHLAIYAGHLNGNMWMMENF